MLFLWKQSTLEMRQNVARRTDKWMKESAEPLAVLALTPLIQRDHLINWEDGMYIRRARGTSLLHPIPKPSHTPTPAQTLARGKMFHLCVCVWCVRSERENRRSGEGWVARRCDFSGGPAESKWRSTCVNILMATMSHKACWSNIPRAASPPCKEVKSPPALLLCVWICEMRGSIESVVFGLDFAVSDVCRKGTAKIIVVNDDDDENWWWNSLHRLKSIPCVVCSACFCVLCNSAWPLYKCL